MATHSIARAVTPAAPTTTSYDRRFYLTMSIAIALTVFGGFSRTYYLKFLSTGPAVTLSGLPITPLIHLHSLVFTAWTLFFIVQTVLVSSRRVAVHRRLGWVGVALAATMVIVGLSTAIASAARGSAPPGVDALVFMAIPFFDIVMFTTFVTGAVIRRRDREAHKRLMLLAYISIMAAPIARIPGVLALGPPAAFGFSLVFLITAIVYDAVSRRRVHPVYIWGGALLILSVPVRLAVSGTAAWRAFAEWLT